MGAILDLLRSIGDAILTAFDFLKSFFDNTVYVIGLTGEFVSQIPSYFSWLPAPVLSLIVTSFGVVVVYKILGREG